jgi:hypothetical protein
VAWELYTGKSLFRAAHPLAQLRQVLTAEIPRIDSVRAEVGTRVSSAVAHALERGLAQRTSDMNAFARELREAADAEFGVASPEEVRNVLLDLCGEDIRKMADSIALARAPSRNSRLSVPPEAVRKHAPWAVAMLGALAASLALWPHATPRSTANAREAVVGTMTSRAVDLEVPVLEDAGNAEHSVLVPEDVAPRKERGLTELKKAPLVRKARPQRVQKKVARPRAQPKASAPASESPLLDVSAFERERRRSR